MSAQGFNVGVNDGNGCPDRPDWLSDVDDEEPNHFDACPTVMAEGAG